MRSIITIFLLCLSAILVRGQTTTVVDAAGQTIVEFITIDPVALVPTTEILSTVTAAADADETTATLTSSSTTTTALDQGPVGQPAATETGETTFQYTTTDANGNQVVVDDTFTPSFDTVVVTPTPTFTGTLLDYSSWLSLVGTNTVADQTVAASGSPPVLMSRPALLIVATLSAGILGGMWLVI